ncbi:flagellar hook protein FlgE [Oceanisphaera psychrotolerans]|uniref:Flagellar hook protein FlgE n=1 Tax=Oceanisphaera psychrotolerans TaxID=1414654 RepID=A0A1J4QBF2_9GAMM|nr:flagellar hook protein FlgE [Oceanisphaera psychrotolerans]OIN07729.1 flagellar hook protein FlgE [Oceanisphaera psychrotolerans]
MSFNIALSGVNASQKDLDVTANNIANVNTVGFKESRAEFADIYSNSLFSNARTQVGGGVQTAAVAQQFHQGSLLSTDNALDMAINGNGFFVMSSENGSTDRTFTRAGAFSLDSNGFVVNSQGSYLQTFAVNENGAPTSLSLNATKPLQIPAKAGTPTQTETVDGSMNLPANATGLDPADFDPTVASTYTSSTSVTIFDSLGEPHTLTQYFVKDATGADNEWKMFAYVDGKDALGVVTDPATGDPVLTDPADLTSTTRRTLDLTFDVNGKISAPTPARIDTDALNFGNGSNTAQIIDIGFDSITQFASSFEVSRLTQDGATVGKLTNINIGTDGTVAATYSNGIIEKLGIVAMASFPNDQGLTQTGDTEWRESLLSGEALVGQPNTGTLGKIDASKLEQSNTNLTTELVDLITAQRNFQANSRALEVNSTLMQTVLQIR